MEDTAADSSLPENVLLQQYNSAYRNKILPVTVIFGLEIVFGFFGNLLTLYVFLFRYKPCNFRYFVLCLAIIDFASCVTTIPGEMVSQLNWFAYPTPPVCHIKDFFNQFTVISDAGCLTVIAIDRFRKVCRPLGWQIKQRRAVLSCIGIYVIAAILAIPTQIFWGIHSNVIVYKGRNITATFCEKAEKYKNSEYPFVYVIFNGCLVFICLICMFVLYVKIVRKLITGQQQTLNNTVARKDGLAEISAVETESACSSNEMASESVSQNQASNTNQDKVKNKGQRMAKIRRKTLIMFYLTVIYIVTIVIYYILLTAVGTGLLSTLTDSQRVAVIFFLRLYFVNHVINPVLYGILDPKFRAEMRRLKGNFTSLFWRCARK